MTFYRVHEQSTYTNRPHSPLWQICHPSWLPSMVTHQCSHTTEDRTCTTEPPPSQDRQSAIPSLCAMWHSFQNSTSLCLDVSSLPGGKKYLMEKSRMKKMLEINGIVVVYLLTYISQSADYLRVRSTTVPSVACSILRVSTILPRPLYTYWYLVVTYRFPSLPSLIDLPCADHHLSIEEWTLIPYSWTRGSLRTSSNSWHGPDVSHRCSATSHP